MILVADASFAAKVLLSEGGREVVRGWWIDESVTWLAPALIGPEVEAAIAVHHRNHPEKFGDNHRKLASTTWATMLDAIVLHTVNRSLSDEAMRMIEDFGPLRGADACYVATAGRILDEGEPDVVLGSFDRQQRRAAHQAGITIAPATQA